jgi:hypothetical protein
VVGSLPRPLWVREFVAPDFGARLGDAERRRRPDAEAHRTLTHEVAAARLLRRRRAR